MHQKGFAPIFIVLLLAAFGAGVLVSKTYYEKTTPQEPTKSDNTPPTSKVSNISSPTNINEWVEYKIKILGFSFHLPKNLADKYGQIMEKEIEGERGSQVEVVFSKSQQLSIAAQSPEYTPVLSPVTYEGEPGVYMGAPGIVTTTLFSGFKEENGTYFGVLPLGGVYELPSEYITQYRINGFDIIKVKALYGRMGSAARRVYPENPPKIWAIINLGNRIYPGVTIQAILEDDFTEDIFEQILSTFNLNYP